VQPAKNIFLVGPMGAGKTTIGRQLASELGMEFKDTDREIEERSGADIAWIFDVEGEAGFRRRESAVLEELALQDGLVLATGGGCIMAEGNRKVLKTKGVVVYLKTDIHQQVKRTAKDKKRPLLQTEDPVKVLTELNAIRQPLYQEVADITVETDSRHPKSVVQEILAELNKGASK